MSNPFSEKIDQLLRPYQDYISRETFCQLVDINKAITIPKGKLVSADHKAFLLLAGIIRGYYLDADGNDVTHLFIFGGTTYGSDFLTNDKPHMCNLGALVECTAVELNRVVLLTKIESDPCLMMAYIHKLVSGLEKGISIYRQPRQSGAHCFVSRDYAGVPEPHSPGHPGRKLTTVKIGGARMEDFTKQEPISSRFGAKTTARQITRQYDLRRKNVIVTGGYSGVELEITKALALAGAEVLVPVRNLQKAQAALKGISHVRMDTMNLMKAESIDAFTTRFLATEKPLHPLINDAGIMVTVLNQSSWPFPAYGATLAPPL